MRRLLLVVLAVAVLIAAPTVWWRVHNARVPLLSMSVAVLPDGGRVDLPPGDRRALYPGSRVIQNDDPRAAQLAQRQREWVRQASAALPRTSFPDLVTADLVRAALLDLDTLRLDNGAVVASWPQSWRYVWPRDASFVAVALARTGRHEEAVHVLAYLQHVQPAGGAFDARYLPDGSRAVPDDRGEQSDGAAWALWAVREVLRGAGSDAERAAAAERLLPLISRSTRALMAATDTETRLPAPSLDYWELPSDTLTLGTAAPIALGLRAAVDLLDELDKPGVLDQPGAAAAVRERAVDVDAAVRAGFAPDYPRFLGKRGSDAAVAFRLPPFTDCVDPEVRDAWREAARGMRRPAGGLAPGTTWPNNGISWTPQTALFALTAASLGDHDRAVRWLSWLDTHRTAVGSLPEKVLSNGEPAGPAPLSWTAALVVLAVAATADPPAPVCSP